MSGPFGASQFMYATASGFYPFEISNSLRFDDGASDDLNFTPGSAGNRKTMTWSGWVKRGNLGNQPRFFGSGGDNYICFNSEKIEINLRSGGSSSNAFIITNRLHRDVSAWYHIVMAIDTTQATDTNRVKLYVNGVQETSFEEDAYPSQNNDLNSFNNTVAQYIGRFASGSYYDGYMADVNFIDGLALTPASFGQLKNDIWIPKDTSGLTFGTNGYRLQFKQTGTSQNSSGIGADTSGNDNHFAVANLTAVDVVLDTPTNNFATINVLDQIGSNTITEGNLKTIGGGDTETRGTISLGNGKWYWEVRSENYTANMFGISEVGETGANYFSANNGIAYYGVNGYKYVQASGASYGASYGNGDIIGHAYDGTNNTLTYYKNNSSQGAITVPDVEYVPSISGAGSHGGIFNFGQDSSFAGATTAQNNADGNGIGDFYYSPPSGFLALCTANLPDPVETIDPAQGGSVQDYFQTKLYTGNGQSSLDIDLDFTPDFVWIKRRNATQSYVLANKLSGDDKFMATNGTGAEETDNTKFRNFLTNSFRVGSHNGVNNNGSDYVSWNLKANGSGSSNTDGSLNTTATSVAAHNGFSISTYTGTGSSTTIGHGIGGAPDLILIKQRNEARDWYLYNSINAGDGYLYLNNTSMALETDANRNDRIGNGSSYVAPTSTVITLGTSSDVNGSSKTYVMYCFRNIDGYQKIGTFTGNGSNDGKFVYTGFRPSFVLIKRTNTTGDWVLYDSERYGFNDKNAPIYPAEDIAEGSGTQSSRLFDILSNGFKPRTDNANLNADGSTYLYWAIAKQPFKYSNAR